MLKALGIWLRESVPGLWGQQSKHGKFITACIGTLLLACCTCSGLCSLVDSLPDPTPTAQKDISVTVTTTLSPTVAPTRTAIRTRTRLATRTPRPTRASTSTPLPSSTPKAVGTAGPTACRVRRATTKSVVVGGSIPPKAPPTATLTLKPTCYCALRYVADLTIPDGTSLEPGTTFTKTWSVMNAGTCPWRGGYRLVFSRGLVVPLQWQCEKLRRLCDTHRGAGVLRALSGAEGVGRASAGRGR